MIPTILHQIWWQGPKNISNIHTKYIKTWKDKHPNFNYILWDRERFELLLIKLNNTLYNYIYNNLPYMIQKIDFCKYLILYTYGGIYVDIDTICEKTLISFIDDNFNLIVSKILVYPYINYKLINNGIIFSSKNNRFFYYLFLNIKLNIHPEIYYNKDYYILKSTGPLCFTETLYNYLLKTQDIKILILDESYFESNTLMELNNYSRRGKYITHIHNSSWTSYLFKLHFIIVKWFNYINFL